jgi:hypothetical protein
LRQTVEHIADSPRLIIFPKQMAAQAPIPPDQPQQQPLPAPTQPTWWQQHGTTATWVAIVAALAVGFANTGSNWYFRHVDSSAKSSDEHIRNLVEDKFRPLSRDVFDDKVGKLSDKIDKLSDKIDALSQRVARLEGPDGRIAKLETRTDQQASLARVMDPSRVLATIRADIQIATSSGKVVPTLDLIDYKNAVQALPASAREYWTTVAAIINYQSLINQMSGEAPDPAKVSRPCIGITEGTGGYNLIIGAPISHCVVDLDSTHNALWNVVIKDSVIRYHGGPVNVSAVFVNCTFILDLPPNKAPAQPVILYALLNSDQRTVRVSTPR